MSDQYKNVMIALFVLAASAIAAFILLFIHPDVGDDRKFLRVRFADIDKVSIGTRVTYGGKPVGEVVEIRDIETEKKPRQSLNGRVYLYELDLRVDSSVDVYNSDEVSLRTSGLLGEKSVAIMPRPPQPGQKLRNIDDELIYATETGSVEQTFQELKEVANKFDEVLENINRAVEDLHSDGTFKSVARVVNHLADITSSLNKPKEIDEILASVHHLMQEADESWPIFKSTLKNAEEASDHIRDISAALDQPDSIAEMVDNLHQLSHKAVCSWDSHLEPTFEQMAIASEDVASITSSLNQPRKWEEILDGVHCVSSGVADQWPAIDATIVSVADATQDASALLERIRQGKGSAGELLMGNSFYLQLKALLNKAEVTADDVNHYGLLFHLDKGWQRQRARRMNFLGRLATPQQFSNYFNQEIGLISTALARVGCAMEKQHCLYPCEPPLDDKDFAKVYAELLRRVEGMEEALQLYNQQLADRSFDSDALRSSPAR